MRSNRLLQDGLYFLFLITTQGMVVSRENERERVDIFISCWISVPFGRVIICFERQFRDCLNGQSRSYDVKVNDVVCVDIVRFFLKNSFKMKIFKHELKVPSVVLTFGMILFVVVFLLG